MAKEPPTVSELRKAAEVTDKEIDAAVDAAIDAVLASRPSKAFSLPDGEPLALGELPPTKLHLVQALETHERPWKRNMVRIAILLAHLVKR